MNECFNGTDLETVDEEARGKSDGTACTLDSIGRGSSHNIKVGPWFSKSVPCTQYSWTKKSSIKVQEDA